MVRTLVAVVVVLSAPALLAAQAPASPAPAAKPAFLHGIALHVQGEVVSPVDEVNGQNNQEGVDEVDGQNNDGQNDDGEFNQEGVNEPDGMNNDVNAGDQVDQAGENEDNGDTPAPPPSTGQVRQVGRHKP